MIDCYCRHLYNVTTRPQRWRPPLEKAIFSVLPPTLETGFVFSCFIPTQKKFDQHLWFCSLLNGMITQTAYHHPIIFWPPGNHPGNWSSMSLRLACHRFFFFQHNIDCTQMLQKYKPRHRFTINLGSSAYTHGLWSVISDHHLIIILFSPSTSDHLWYAWSAIIWSSDFHHQPLIIWCLPSTTDHPMIIIWSSPSKSDHLWHSWGDGCKTVWVDCALGQHRGENPRHFLMLIIMSLF